MMLVMVLVSGERVRREDGKEKLLLTRYFQGLFELLKNIHSSTNE